MTNRKLSRIAFDRPSKPFYFAAACLVFLACGSSPSWARSFRVRYIPGGDKFSCLNCHFDPDGGGALNPFGLAVESLVSRNGREEFWGPYLAGLDSDGDGLSNGEELQDESGAWKVGMAAPGDYNSVTPPGVIGDAPPAPKGPDVRLDQSVRLRYDSDAQGGDLDASFFTNLSARDIIPGRLDLKLSGWGLWDIDSDDAYDNALDRRRLRLSEAYFDIHDLGPIGRARLGRQYLYRVDNIHMDGAFVTTPTDRRVSFFAFGGRPVTYYEAVGHNEWLAGAGTLIKPSWRASHQFDFYQVRENGESLFASAWRWNQYWVRQWRTTSRLRFLDSEIRDFRLLLSKYVERWKLGVSLNYYLQPNERGGRGESRARSLSSLGAILGPRPAYHRLSADINKYFGDDWHVQLGGSIQQRLSDEGDFMFNAAESYSGRLTATRFNVFAKNLDLTLGVETIRNDYDSFWALTGSAGYRPVDEWQFSLGATLSEYRLDPIGFSTSLNGQDFQDSYTRDFGSILYYGRTNWRPNHGRWDVFAELGWEDVDSLESNAWNASLGVNFHVLGSKPRKR